MLAEKQTSPRIVLVDDDELVLSSLRLLFEMEAGYQLIAFADPHRAIDELGRRPVDAVISDYLMPGMNGIDLLKHARRLQPDAVRILLTGFADKQNAIRAVNEAGLYQYLEKPWDNDQLIMVMRNGLQQRSLRQQLAEKIKTLDHLVEKHSELAARHTHLESELKMAAKVQESLLPRDFPEIAGFRFDSFYRPCQALGGDYFDFVANEERVIVLVSDVSGHGVQAALVSMLIKAIFHTTGARAEDPAALLSEMNASLHQFLPQGLYVAAAAVWLDRRGLAVRIGNAGLPYPFLIRSSQNRFDEVPIGGVPLGLFSGNGVEPYDVREIDMQEGDVLIVASDGLGETESPAGELFWESQLPSCLQRLSQTNGACVISTLMEAAARFGDKEQLPDDVSLVTIARTTNQAS